VIKNHQGRSPFFDAVGRKKAEKGTFFVIDDTP